MFDFSKIIVITKILEIESIKMKNVNYSDEQQGVGGMFLELARKETRLNIYTYIYGVLKF